MNIFLSAVLHDKGTKTKNLVSRWGGNLCGISSGYYAKLQTQIGTEKWTALEVNIFDP